MCSQSKSCCLEKHHHHLQQLLSAPRPRGAPQGDQQQDQQLRSLVHRFLTHYENYYKARAHAAKTDPLTIFSPAWATPLERAFQWIAGWRPTTAFHILYSESSLHFDNHLADRFLRGFRSGDLADLTPSQLTRISDMQCLTVNEENEVTNEMSELQEGIGDGPFPSSEIVHMEAEVEGLAKVLERADDLRLRTIQRVIAILSPLQAVDFLVAAAELEIGVRQWGMRRD